MIEYIGIALIIVLSYSIYLYLDYKKSEAQLKVDQAKFEIQPNQNQEIPSRVITLQELHKNDGKNGANVWLAVKDLVFDVSNSEAYKENGSYSIFAGQDCTVAFAKMDMSGNFLNRSGNEVLDENEIKTMNEWYGFFQQKYKVVGKLSDKKDN